MQQSREYALLSGAFVAVVLAQFISALADNAILIAAIALLKHQQAQSQIPLLQASFLIAYVVLAPFVGPFADGCAKNRVMIYANGLKLAGAILMASGLNAILSYGLIGIGAALYSPAKYGILPEMLTAGRLIRANAMIESSTILAIILGVLIGGISADHCLHGLLIFCGAAYLLSAVINALMPSFAAQQQFRFCRLGSYALTYFGSVVAIWHNPKTKLSVLGTSIFWSVGATLRLILFAWIPLVFLSANNALPSNLMGVLSIGVAVGALLAVVWVKLGEVRRVLLPGLLLGPLIMLTSVTHSLITLGALMLLIGLCGGMFVVPLNALLQEQGHLSMGSGRALAVQNFFENTGMLIMVLAYDVAECAHVGLMQIILSLGLLTLFVLLGLSRIRLTAQLN